MNPLQSLIASISVLFNKKPLKDVKQVVLTEAISLAIQKEQHEKGPDLRHQHPKSHGLLHGSFTVLSNIPDRCKFGVFATPKTYPIWVRYSNGSTAKERGVFKPDPEGDVRGMAVKLMDVGGRKLSDDEQHTQDFILANYPVFFLKDVQDYVDFATFNAKPTPELKEKLTPAFKLLQAIDAQKVGNPLLIRYWSTTPYKLGSTPIKFLVKPHKPEVPPDSLPDSPNYLREAMVKFFATTEESVKFDFQVQFYVDDVKTPVEDPTKEWHEADSPPITVATIEIPKQAFDFDERKRLDEGLSFNPWHALPDHEPLGSINQSRRKIYKDSAKHRREYMQGRSKEPQPYSVIHDDPK
ncbi:catalase family protein [Tumidithrix elongata RA019]|uniref:Catalase family protein n=1 Tax=Tumidithrix elongata BACA0141 TaxID=2716417 RepID=A0AAW9PPI0_9CYAN|nr:catalase family protein [Tumidithrix elongata RA019]